jgi:hypothetical protein
LSGRRLDVIIAARSVRIIRIRIWIWIRVRIRGKRESDAEIWVAIPAVATTVIAIIPVIAPIISVSTPVESMSARASRQRARTNGEDDAEHHYKSFHKLKLVVGPRPKTKLAHLAYV